MIWLQKLYEINIVLILIDNFFDNSAFNILIWKSTIQTESNGPYEGNSEHAAHACRKIGVFWEKNATQVNFNYLVVTALDLIKFLKQRLLLTCAPVSELPSDIYIMVSSIN